MFQKAWDEAKKLNKNSTKLSENELLSVVVYTLENPRIYQVFNDQTREFQKSLGDERFQYKGMHFFLHSAINKLQDKVCPYHVYRGVTHKVTADVGDGFHFDFFTSTTTNLKIAKQFGTQNRPNNTWEEITIFEIPETFKGAKLGRLSKFAGEEEVVIPPCEKFRVVEIETEKTKWVINNLKKKVKTTQIVLESESNY